MTRRSVNQFAVAGAWRVWLGITIAAFAALAILTLGLATPVQAQGQFYSFTNLHTFGGTGGDGQNPHNGSLLRDASGNLFGTTEGGGTYGGGTVFELVNSSGSYTERILYSFAGVPGDGAVPVGGVIIDSSGNLYGTTQMGGYTPNLSSGFGTVFELINSSGTYTEKILYTFRGSPDGTNPFAGLTMDSTGNLFGTTLGGGTGANHSGTVFELVNSSGTYTEKVLYSFTNTDGTCPFAGVILDTVGNLYGATGGAGPGITGAGSVFELVNSLGTYTEKVLYTFTGGSDGASPVANLLMDSSGNLYGTTQNGGDFSKSSVGAGTVFELVNSSGTYTERILHTFTGNAGEGADPTGTLIMDSSGNLFGTTAQWWSSAALTGTVFELVNSSGGYSEKVLSVQPCGSGEGLVGYAYAGLIMDPSGNLYGTTGGTGFLNSGATVDGTVFEFVSNSVGSASATTTTVTSSSNPAPAGPSMNIIATVTSSLPTPPTGTVTFFNDGTQFATMALSCGTAQYSGNSESIGVGTFTITAEYLPDNTALFQPSSASLTQTVNEYGAAVTNGNNTFNGNQTINGAVSATSFSGIGSGLTNLNPANLSPGTAAINITGNAATATMATLAAIATNASNADNAANAVNLNGVAASNYARLDIANAFTGDQKVTGNVSATGSLTIGGGSPIVESVSITTSVTLPVISKNSCTTLTTGPVTGFTPGATDTIALGVPQPLTFPGGGVSLMYQAWETTTTTSPTITINVCNPTGTDYAGGGTGTIRADIFKH